MAGAVQGVQQEGPLTTTSVIPQSCTPGRDRTVLWTHHLDDSCQSPGQLPGDPSCAFFSLCRLPLPLPWSFLSFGGRGLEGRVFMLLSGSASGVRLQAHMAPASPPTSFPTHHDTHWPSPPL